MMHKAKVRTEAAIEQHGGDLSQIAVRFPAAPRPYIDLSTGINPDPYPFPEIEPAWLSRLCEPGELTVAEDAAAHYYGVKQLVLASGMQPLMLALAALRLKEKGPSRIQIFAPTYAEHAKVWQSLGHEVGESGEVAIICNPNNPDGRIIARTELLALAERVEWLIVDESFADLAPEMSVAGARKNIIVLRSTGKFFGAAGLRVSAAIAHEKITAWLRATLGPWPISTAACKMLPAMFADIPWQKETRMHLKQQAMQWRALLAQYFTVAGHTDLFTLVETDDAPGWHVHLMAQGMLVRQFDYNPCWLRFGLPRQNDILRIEAALASYG